MSLDQAALPIIDADAHVLETEHTWDFLLPEDEKYRPTLVSSQADPVHQYWVIDGSIAGFRFPTLTERELTEQSARTGRNVQTEEAAREMNDVSLRVQHLDELGIDYQVLHNTLWIAQITDRPEIDVALCGAWNRWMADVWRQGNGRLFWTAVVPSTDFDAAREQMRFCKENGAVAICLRPFESSLHLTDRHFYPLYEEAVSLQIGVAIHIANGSPYLNDVMKNPVPGFGGPWAQFRIPAVIAGYDIVTSHIHEDFPTLNWGIIEASAQWMTWVAHELRARTGKPFSPESNPFTENNVYVTCQMDDDLGYLVDTLGDDAIVIGTDYGHTDTSSDIDAIQGLRESDAIGEDSKRKILSVNPAKLYYLSDLPVPTAV